MIKVSLQGQEFSLDPSGLKKIGRGGEGDIYLVNLAGQNYALKIYFKPTQVKYQKILAMLENTPADAIVKINSSSFIQLAWPLGLAFINGNFVGFLMPYVDLGRSSTLDFYLDKSLYDEKFSHNPLSLTYRIEIARNIAGVIKSLHARNHYFIDFKPQNVRVYDRYHLISLIDCDGFSIAGTDGTRYPAESFSSEYICPYALRNNSQPAALGLNQDLFALAVVIFQILNFGIHPFSGLISQGDSASTTDEKVSKGYYPYGKIEHPNIKPIKNSTHFTLNDDVRDLFDKAFSSASSSPPRVDQWIEVLDKLLVDKLLVKCESFPNNAEHIRFEGKECAVCFRSAISSRVRINSSAKATSYTPKKGTPFNVAGSTAGIGAAKNVSPNALSGEIFGIEKKILLVAVSIGIVIALFLASIGSDKKTSYNSQSSPASSPAPVNPALGIQGKWETGSTCADQNLYIYADGGNGGTFTYTYSDASKNHVTSFRNAEKTSDGLYTFTVDDGSEYGHVITYKKVNNDQIRVWKLVVYPKTNPSDKTAYALNGMVVETAKATGIIDRCR